jgi:RimJ/RimL family protein N-acetyltransferase
MGIWLKSENKYVGQIWIKPKNWEVPLFEIGWFLDQSYQRREVATEAAQRSLDSFSTTSMLTKWLLSPVTPTRKALS